LVDHQQISLRPIALRNTQTVPSTGQFPPNLGKREFSYPHQTFITYALQRFSRYG
jgi:hypothetical protein